MKNNEIVSRAWATIVAFATTVFAYVNGLHVTVKVLLLFMAVDFLLGVINAIIEKQLTKKAMYRGGIKKGVTFLVLIVAYYLGVITHQPIVLEGVTMYYIAMETLSIFEHAVKLDVPLPKFLVKIAETLKQENDEVE